MYVPGMCFYYFYINHTRNVLQIGTGEALSKDLVSEISFAFIIEPLNFSREGIYIIMYLIWTTRYIYHATFHVHTNLSSFYLGLIFFPFSPL